MGGSPGGGEVSLNFSSSVPPPLSNSNGWRCPPRLGHRSTTSRRQSYSATRWIATYVEVRHSMGRHTVGRPPGTLLPVASTHPLAATVVTTDGVNTPPASHSPRAHRWQPFVPRGSASSPIQEILVESLTPPLHLGPICGTVECSPCTSWLPLALLSTLCWAALSKASSFPSSLFSLLRQLMHQRLRSSYIVAQSTDPPASQLTPAVCAVRSASSAPARLSNNRRSCSSHLHRWASSPR